MSAGVLAGLDGPEARGTTERAGTDERRALEQPRRRHGGRKRAHRRHLGEDAEVGALARLSVPIATGTADS